MKNLLNTVKSGLQFFIGAVVVMACAVLIVSLTEQRKIIDLPSGWAVLRDPGEVSALLVNGPEIWAGGRDGLTIIDRKTLEVLETPTEVKKIRYIRALHRAVDESIWIAHSKGVTQYFDGNWRYIPAEDMGLSGAIYTVLSEPSGTVWIGGEAGLARGVGNTFERVVLPANATLTTVSTLFRDSAGVLWVGSDSHVNGGLLSLTQGVGWQFYTVGEELHHASVTDIIEDRAGTIWVATGFAGRGAVSLFAGGEWEKLERDVEFDNRKVRSVFEDQIGQIWLGYEYDGLSVFDGEVWFNIDHADGLAGEEVKAVRQDEIGTYWIATPEGLSVIKRNAFGIETN